jgi:hypothetical protein
MEEHLGAKRDNAVGWEDDGAPGQRAGGSEVPGEGFSPQAVDRAPEEGRPQVLPTQSSSTSFCMAFTQFSRYSPFTPTRLPMISMRPGFCA